MKVEAIINCCGIGYDLKAGDKADLKKELAEVLIKFEYVKEVPPKKAAK